MKKKLKINFVDFWPDFELENNFFYNLLTKYYELEISEKPDLLFYSNFGFEHLKYTCKKIFYTGENKKPNFNCCDYAFSFADDSPKNYFLPHFIEYGYFFDLKQNNIPREVQIYRNEKKSRFCSFIASNANAKERIEFVKQLMKYKKVDCSGPVLYNMEEDENKRVFKNENYDNWRTEKLEIIKQYKFTIAFENERSYNYITEKIYQPFLVGSVPIYWGAPNINEFFNPKCFIDVSQFKNFSDAIEYIKEVDRDENLYKSFFEEPPILPNSKLQNISIESIHLKINKIINNSAISIGEKNEYYNKSLYFIKKFKYKLLK